MYKKFLSRHYSIPWAYFWAGNTIAQHITLRQVWTCAQVVWVVRCVTQSMGCRSIKASQCFADLNRWVICLNVRNNISAPCIVPQQPQCAVAASVQLGLLRCKSVPGLEASSVSWNCMGKANICYKTFLPLNSQFSTNSLVTLILYFMFKITSSGASLAFPPLQIFYIYFGLIFGIISAHVVNLSPSWSSCFKIFPKFEGIISFKSFRCNLTISVKFSENHLKFQQNSTKVL